MFGQLYSIPRRRGRVSRVRLASALTTALAVAAASATAVFGATEIKPYVEPVGEEYEIRPLFSVADKVPETSDPSRQYQMVGIPDGLGAHPNGDGTSTTPADD
jgi:hypothetical protein